MNKLSQGLIRGWVALGPRFLPFADAATPELPLGRLLRLSLFQISVGMALVLMVGTLNRVMIVELGVPASLVAIMLALPILAAPFRALIGHKSDHHRSHFGWRRVPFIWMGTMTQFGGLTIMPFALLVLAGQGESASAAPWVGQAAAGLAFLLVGAGLHTVQTAGLALATDLAPEEAQPRVVGLMYVMLLLGMAGSALLFGWLLADFTPAKLIQVIQGAAIATLVINLVALWKQESVDAKRARAQAPEPSFAETMAGFLADGRARRRLLVIAGGTIGFAMQDVLLEPYGGAVLKLSVSGTTLLSAALAFGGLVGFGWASRVLGRGGDPLRMAAAGMLAGIPGFALIILSAPLFSTPLLVAGVLAVGFGGGLFGHGTLTATMQAAPRDQVGLALGAWGAAQATAAGVGTAIGGVLRDAFAWTGADIMGRASGYVAVYALEILVLLATLLVMLPLLRGRAKTPDQPASASASPLR
jgi:MFS transporter, BCD family, chlorophyll transporter